MIWMSGVCHNTFDTHWIALCARNLAKLLIKLNKISSYLIFICNFCSISRNLAASQPLKASFHGIRFAQVFSAVRPIKKLEANYDTPSFASTRPLALLWSTTTSAVPTSCPLSPFWGFLPDTLMIKIKMQLKFGRVCLERSTAQFSHC